MAISGSSTFEKDSIEGESATLYEQKVLVGIFPMLKTCYAESLSTNTYLNPQISSDYGQGKYLKYLVAEVEAEHSMRSV